jgi:hypothetical protein
MVAAGGAVRHWDDSSHLIADVPVVLIATFPRAPGCAGSLTITPWRRRLGFGAVTIAEPSRGSCGFRFRRDRL